MVAASLLPVCIHNHELYFLFGKENNLEDSAKGWSDFGGRVENNESIYQGALREGAEEMTGFLGNEHDLKKRIRNNGGYHRISHNKYHVHLFYLPYEPKLVEYYNYNHKFLWDRMDHKLLNKTVLFEKIELKWYALSDMKKHRLEFRSFYQEIVDKFIENEKKIKQFLHECKRENIAKK